jgi:uncharacterized protein (TIGR00730 family)
MHPLGDKEHEFRIVCDPAKQVCYVENAYESHGKKWTDQALVEMITNEAASVGTELMKGLDLIKKYPKSVTFYGGVNMPEGSKYYEKARRLAGRICKEGFAVISGGGPGIMEAANRGAYEACGSSIGLNIELPREQFVNKYVTHGMNFEYFFTRKTVMHFSSEVFLFFPGGFGTFDECFELLTLMQTKKSPIVPLIMVGSDFWRPFDTAIRKVMDDKYHTIEHHHLDLYRIIDNEDEILEAVKHAPTRSAYNELKAEEDGHAEKLHQQKL